MGIDGISYASESKPKQTRQELEQQRVEIRKADKWSRAATFIADVAYYVDFAATIPLIVVGSLTGCNGQQLPSEIPPRDFDTEVTDTTKSSEEKSFGQEPVYDENLHLSLKDLSVKTGDKPLELLPVLTVGYTNPQWKFRKFQGDAQYLGLTPNDFESQDAETMAFGISGLTETIPEENKAYVTGKCMAVINPDPSIVLGLGENIIFPRIFIRVGTVAKEQMESIFGKNDTWKSLFSNPEDDTLIFKEAATIDDVKVRLDSITAEDLGLTQEEFESTIAENRYTMGKIFTDHIKAEDELKAKGNPSAIYLKGIGAGNFVDTAMTLQAPYYFNPDFQWRVYAYADKDIVSQISGGPQGKILDPDMASMRWWAWADDQNGVPGKMWTSWAPYANAANSYNTIALISGATMDQKHAFLDGTSGTSLPELPINWPAVPDVPVSGLPQDGATYYNTGRNKVSNENANGFAISGRDHSAMIYAAPNGASSHRTDNLHTQFMIINTGFADSNNMQNLYCNINFFQQNTR